MASTLTIVVTDLESEPLAFPATCVGCGGVPVTTSLLSFAKVVTNARGAQNPVHLKIPVPHCQACARSTKAVFLAGLVPFACKLPAELVKRLNERAAAHEGGVNALVAEALQKSLA